MRLVRLVFIAAVCAALVAGCAGDAPNPGSASTPPTSSAAISQASATAAPAPSASSSVLVIKLAAIPENMQIANSKPTWSTTTLSVPANQPFQIALTVPNSDTHNLWVEDAGGKAPFQGDDLVGPRRKTYEIPALGAGTYRFVCTFHRSSMSGTLTVR